MIYYVSYQCVYNNICKSVFATAYPKQVLKRFNLLYPNLIWMDYKLIFPHLFFFLSLYPV